MANNYNFDEIQGEQPFIRMGGHDYKLRYPTVSEVEKIQDLKTDLERADLVYSFVEVTKENQPPFKEVLMKMDIRVLKAFTEMIQKEFGIE